MPFGFLIPLSKFLRAIWTSSDDSTGNAISTCGADGGVIDPTVLDVGFSGEADNGADVGIRTVAGHAGADEADVLHRAVPDMAEEAGINFRTERKFMPAFIESNSKKIPNFWKLFWYLSNFPGFYSRSTVNNL